MSDSTPLVRRSWFLRLIASSFLVALLCGYAAASPVGERHLVAKEPSAALRDARHRDVLRITVWYPAAKGANESSLAIGPKGRPLFTPGTAAADAPFADDKRRPIILFSHGYGGTARMMAWFGTALARKGYIVIAVDHPGNKGSDPMTIAGAALFWERPGDLAAALARVESDSQISAHLDVSRIGVAGFSAGGVTALAASGARVDPSRFEAFCKTNPNDGVCRPQEEFPVTRPQEDAFLARPQVAAVLKHSHDSLAIPGVKAAFVMAPAIVQSFDPASLSHISVPVQIILGDSDTVAPPSTNGEFAARLIPNSQIDVLPGVGHHDFLSDCTAAGDVSIPICRTTVPRDKTHRTTIEHAVAFFGRTVGTP